MRFYLANLYLGRVLLAACMDATAFALAAAVTWVVLDPPFAPLAYAAAVAASILFLFTLLYYTDAYGLTVLGSGRKTLFSVAAAFGVAATLGLSASVLLDLPPHARETAAHLAGIYAPLLLVARLAFRLLSGRPRFAQRVLILGHSDLSGAIARAVRERRNLGTEIVGFLSDDPDDQGAWIEGFPVIGRIHELDKLVERTVVDRVVVASKRRDEFFPAEDLLRLKLLGTKIDSGVSFYERVTGHIYLRDLRPSYLIFNEGFALGRTSMALKRALDLTVATIGLLLAAPVLAVAMLAVRLDTPGPVFFLQERVGRGGRPFRVWKLRSMRHGAEDETGAVWCADNDDRVTRVGRVIRPTRIDELPQLWNVLRGDMSLVGPRPERPEFVGMLAERYPYFRARSAVRPGITGWAQIRGGYVNDVKHVEEKLALDFYYLKYRSFLMDLLILWKTVKTVVQLKGV
jgi:exopolysaccharide biosynthesis polyprenyl glycosylphosphotransferase